MASARSLSGGLRTSEIPNIRTNYLGKGRGRGSRSKNSNNSTTTTDVANATDSQENGSISPVEAENEIEVNETGTGSTDLASKAENKIIHLLKKMCHQDLERPKELSPEDEAMIVDKVLENIMTAEELQNLVSSIYDWALLDPATTSCVASLCATLAKFEKDGVGFRSALLMRLQEDFQSRDQWRKDQQTRWLSFVCLLCDLFAMMKTAANGYMNALIEPVYSCLQQLMMDEEISDKQIKYVTLKLKQLGEILQSNKPHQMDMLMDSLRNRLLGPGITANGRLLLLETIELCASGWEFDESTVQAYAELGQGTQEGM